MKILTDAKIVDGRLRLSIDIQDPDLDLKGDLPGHPFRGNQWSGGGGGGVSLPRIELPKEAEDNLSRELSTEQGMRAAQIAASPVGLNPGAWKKTLIHNGVTEEAIVEMESLFDQHRWGESHQEKADQRIAEAIKEDSPLGHALRVQTAIETTLMDRWESARPAMIDAAEEYSKREMKEAWKEGWGPKNSDAYESWEEQWEVEKQYQFRDLREPVKFYRKGGLDKDVVATSLNERGAQSHSVTGSSSAQPHFRPDHSWTSSELKNSGYAVLGGFGFIQMGYSGENEITWVKL